MESKDIKYWVGFSLIPGIGRVRFTQLENHFGNLEAAWKAAPAELRHTGLDKGPVDAITEWRPRISLEEEMEKLERYGIKAITYHDPGYPSRLKEIYDYPPLLYIKGSLIPQDDWNLAVVGTRRATVYGRQVTEEIVTDLAQSKITITSGLAKGIDSVAHQSALAAGGRTIAVLGCGLDIVYPSENADLASRIIQQGALISEYPLGTRPKAENFPRRNRIMSGMSLGVVVGEASDGLEAIRQAEKLQPNVLVVDISMPGLNGIDVTKQVRKCSPRTGVIVLSMHSAEVYVLQALEAGAMGYIVKESGPDQLVSAIREVVAGRHYLGPPFSEETLETYRRKSDTGNGHSRRG